MEFESAEEMAEFYEANKAQYDMLSGVDGFSLLDKTTRQKVAFVADDRAAAIAMESLTRIVEKAIKE